MGKRRTLAFASIACGALTCGALGWAAPSRADDKPPLKIGVLEDHSGDIAIFTMPKVHGAHLAVERSTLPAASSAARSRSSNMTHNSTTRSSRNLPAV